MNVYRPDYVPIVLHVPYTEIHQFTYLEIVCVRVCVCVVMIGLQWLLGTLSPSDQGLVSPYIPLEPTLNWSTLHSLPHH